MTEINCSNKSSDECTKTTACKLSGSTCVCNTENKYAQKSNDVSCFLCDNRKEPSIKIENGKCVCAQAGQKMILVQNGLKCINPNDVDFCPLGWYKKGDLCFICPDGHITGSSEETCDKCPDDKPISNITRTACQTVSDCEKSTNRLVVGRQCVCKQGSPDNNCNLCGVTKPGDVLDIWNHYCMTAQFCQKEGLNAQLSSDGTKCVCKPGCIPNEPNIDRVSWVPNYACTCNLSQASSATVMVVVITLLTLIAAATAATVVFVKARKARANKVVAVMSTDFEVQV